MTIDTANTSDIRPIVNKLLNDAVAERASDVHIEPTSDGYELRFRVDGLLRTAAHYDSGAGRSIVTRLMVLAQLLTYRLDIPQEGQLRVDLPSLDRQVEMRLAIMPTTHGLRAALRLPADLTQPRSLEQLQLPPNILDALMRFARSDAGFLLVTGPAGSGKTTTIYALLEHIVDSSPGLSVIALEDPVERDITGVTQI